MYVLLSLILYAHLCGVVITPALSDETDVSVYEKYGCGSGLIQWDCAYDADGEVRKCYNISACDMSALAGSYQMCILSLDCVYVDGADLTALYYLCSYRMSWREEECHIVTVLQLGDTYRLCNYDHGINTKPYCFDYSASYYCTYIQPSTNRLTHITVPATVYITGLLLNHLILLVLAWKAEGTVTNCLLKLLAVWDSLYLVCQLAEWVVWMQTLGIQSVIKDVGFAWVDTGCRLQNFGDIFDVDVCPMQYKWKAADKNVVNNLSFIHLSYLPYFKFYVAMYWLHTAARLFQLMSVYQTVIIASFRYIAIQFPFQADRYLTYTTAWEATLGCLVLTGLLHVPSVMGGVALHTVAGCDDKYNTDELTQDQFLQCMSKIANDIPFYTLGNSFVTFFEYYHVIFYHIVMCFALPFLVLLVLNILMMRELWKGTQTQENIAVTRVVVSIVSVFLLSYTIKPFYMIDIFYFNGSLMNTMALSSCSTYFTMSLLIIVLPCLNSSVNFLIYVGLRQSFRRQFVSMFDFFRRRCYCAGYQQEEIELRGYECN